MNSSNYAGPSSVAAKYESDDRLETCCIMKPPIHVTFSPWKQQPQQYDAGQKVSKQQLVGVERSTVTVDDDSSRKCAKINRQKKTPSDDRATNSQEGEDRRGLRHHMKGDIHTIKSLYSKERLHELK